MDSFVELRFVFTRLISQRHDCHSAQLGTLTLVAGDQPLYCKLSIEFRRTLTS